MINFGHQDLWHPNLKRKWLDDRNYVIVDNRRKIYKTSLIQLANDSGFLANQDNHPKMQCGCRFIKQDIVKPASPSTASSFLEVKSNVNLGKIII